MEQLRVLDVGLSNMAVPMRSFPSPHIVVKVAEAAIGEPELKRAMSHLQDSVHISVGYGRAREYNIHLPKLELLPEVVNALPLELPADGHEIAQLTAKAEALQNEKGI